MPNRQNIYTCGLCETTYNYKILRLKKKNEFICHDCVKALGGPFKHDYSNVDIEELRNIINKRDNVVAACSLNSAKAMYLQCVGRNWHYNRKEDWSVANFQILQDALLPEEKVHSTFIGLCNQHTTELNKYHVYAITDIRLLVGRKAHFGKEILYSFSLNNCKSLSLKTSLINGMIYMDFGSQELSIQLEKVPAQAIFMTLQEFCLE